MPQLRRHHGTQWQLLPMPGMRRNQRLFLIGDLNTRVTVLFLRRKQ